MAPPKRRRIALGGFELGGLPASDPAQISAIVLNDYPEEWHDIIGLYYHDFRTRYRHIDGIKTVYVFRSSAEGTDEDDLFEWLKTIYNYQKYGFKIQISITVLLYNIKTEEYDVKVGNEVFLNLFPKPMVIANMEGLKTMRSRIQGSDAVEVGAMGAPDTASRIIAVLSHNVVCYRLGETLPLLGARVNWGGSLPDWVKKSHSVRCLPKDGRDCLFRLLAAHRCGKVRGIKRLSGSLKRQWCESEKINIHKFDGKIPYSRLDDVEQLFEVAISLYEAGPTPNDLIPVKLSKNSTYSEKVLGIVCDGRKHVGAIITHMERLARFYRCECDYVCEKRDYLMAHKKRCDPKPKIKRYGGNYLGQTRNWFDLLILEGVKMDAQDRYYPFFSVFDCETFQRPKIDKISQKKQYETELKVLCMAVNSNLPDSCLGYYSLENCVDAYEMVCKLIDKLNSFADQAEKLMKERLGGVFAQIHERIHHFTKRAQTNRDLDIGNYFIWQINKWTKYRTDLEEHCAMFPVYAYNAHFDISLLKEHIVRISRELGMKFGKIIKTNGKTLLFTVGKLKFRDAMRLTSGSDLRSFLKCYGESDQQKQYFPHSWMTDPGLLRQTQLPEIEKWFDNLSGKSISLEDYNNMVQMWKKLNCHTMGDFLRFYCCSDVEPLIKALENQSEMWMSFGVCQQSGGLSLPSLAMKAVMNEIKGTVGVLLWMPTNYVEDVKIQESLDSNIQGGISQVILRRAEIGKKIEGTDFIPRCLIGLDFNALYAFELSKPQFNGIPRVWSKRDSGSILYSARRLMAKGSSMEELRYCLFMQWYLDGIYGKGTFEIEHKYNYKQLYFKGRKFQLDACIRKENIGFLYQGCNFHPHSNCRRRNPNASEIRKETARMEEEKHFFAKIGWKLYVNYGCEFEQTLAKFPKFKKDVLEPYVNLPLTNKMTGTSILHHIKKGTFFGFLTGVTVYVPEKLWSRFDAFPPIVRHEIMTKSKLSPAMQHWYSKMNYKFGKRRTLLTGFYGENLTLCSDLVQFYLKEGIVIKCFDKAVQFAPVAAFKEFVDMIGQKRAEADKNPNMMAMSNLYKLIGNSIYGKAIQRPEKWSDVSMVEEKDLMKNIRSARFKEYHECGGLFEVSRTKKSHTNASPRLIGYKILNTSKLSLLRLWYDFILHCCGSNGVWGLMSDTDSSYIALIGRSLEDSVLEDRKVDFERLKEEYLAGELTKRTPGKAKIEWTGNKLISLSPKASFGVADDPKDDKYTLKGIRKCLNPMTYEHFAKILETQSEAYGINRGLQLSTDGWHGYKLSKRSLSYSYIKRALIGESGVRTVCLDYFNDTRAKICETVCSFDSD